MADTPQEENQNGTTRRTVLTAGIGAGLGAAVAATAAYSLQNNSDQDEDKAPLARARVGFYGDRQAGIDTPAPAYALFTALDLNQDTDKDALIRMLRILTADAAKLCAGSASLVDQEPELASIPANLTVTVGFGEKVFDIAAPHQKPDWLKPLPAFDTIDQLQEEWNDGDFLLQLCSDDRLTLAHAHRTLLKGARPFASVRWVQDGFARAHGSNKPAETPRNLFGQVDGTINPSTSDGTMEKYVWGQGVNGLTPWQDNGTSVVIRRIHMNLDTWDLADRPAREDAIGRKLSNGAPLTGEKERDPADYSAVNELGFDVISPYAHIRRASAQTELEHILRRPYNYDLPVSKASGIAKHGDISGGISNAGLIFCAYQANPTLQFLPIQRRLAELDMLNTWTTPIGSAVFAIPAGCREGEYIGQTLFEGKK